jgi:hypothetical protein
MISRFYNHIRLTARLKDPIRTQISLPHSNGMRKAYSSALCLKDNSDVSLPVSDILAADMDHLEVNAEVLDDRKNSGLQD